MAFKFRNYGPMLDALTFQSYASYEVQDIIDVLNERWGGGRFGEAEEMQTVYLFNIYCMPPKYEVQPPVNPFRKPKSHES